MGRSAGVLKHLCITGFSRDTDDDSLKFEIPLDPSINEHVATLMGHTRLITMAKGLWELNEAQIQQISSMTGEKLPHDLERLIGVEA